MLDALPDAALHGVLAFLSVRDLGSVRSTCTTIQTAGGADDIWRPLFATRYPVDFAFVDAREAAPEPPPWRASMSSWAALQDRWNGKRSGCKQVVSSFSAHALFCMSSLGDGRFICSGAESTVRVLSPAPGGRVRVTTEWDAGGSGHLGLSVDIAAQTVVTCGFEGLVTLWQLNCAERENLATLPARRLKALLDARGVSYAGLTERADFVARVRATDALPPATRIRALAGHAGAVPGSAHAGDVLITGGNDGTARLWRLSTGTHEVLQSTAAGVDSVAYDAAARAVYTGDKAGTVRLFDASRPGAEPLKTWQAEGWIWCLKPGSTYLHSSGGPEPGAPAFDAPLLVGSTDGYLRVADPRATRWARPPLRVSGPVAGEEGDSSPIAGLAPAWSHSRVTTSSFDGSLSVWDTRTWRRLRHVHVRRSPLPSGAERLTRCDVSRDCAAAAGASGAAYLWSFAEDGPEDSLRKLPLDDSGAASPRGARGRGGGGAGAASGGGAGGWRA